ncbi:MAG TPA: PQ-loop domain-containing transporter [Candidatus Saccharimonadales bacterium]|nr:PQ-loop domain-containing transporter [Candidatus Saccharimonadales bacterium]
MARKSSPLTLEKRVINKAIFLVATAQPLGGIPQVIKLFTTRNAVSISISSWVIFVVFDLMWLWYGLANKQKAIVVSALLFTLMEGAVLVGGILFGGSW